VGVGHTSAWFEGYLEAYAACGRGESDDLRALLQYYGVPLLLTTDRAALALTTEDDVLDAVGRQVEGLRASAYDRSELLSLDVLEINATTTLHTADFSRRRADATEIGRLRVTYLVTVGQRGRRISALAVHTG
jgi:hypothetical protein